MNKGLIFVWLLLGLGYKLQVLASLSITEIVVLVAAPFIFIKNYRLMRRDGVMPFFSLSLFVVLGCVVASIANKTQIQFALRGLATTCLISCSIIVSHWLLRRDPNGFKWFILAMPISVIVSTFIFRANVEVTMLGDSTQDIMGGPIFWISRLNPLVMAPTKGWYLHTPMFINILAPLFMAGFAILSTVSGRSAALGAMAFVAIVIIGGKSSRTMGRISRNFGKLCVLGVIAIVSAYFLYKISVTRGWLGEDARKKYEMQTDGGYGGLGRLILGGRGDSFIGLLACRDKPIIGWGPWPVDENGYSEEFILKYGTIDDVLQLYQSNVRASYNEMAFGLRGRLLPCHAYLTEFWAWYGISGLIFILYILFVMLRYLKQDVAYVPQWFAWLACSIPGMVWSVFFSPFMDRFGTALFIVACLMARAVRKGLFVLPRDMIIEIEKSERK